MLDAPVFNGLPELKSAGGDPLGLEATNLMMMGSVLSGMNNVVRYIRVYSLLCWASWQAKKHCERHGLAEATAARQALFTRLQEKVQLLLNWANWSLQPEVSLIGILFEGFSNPSRARRLTFADYGLANLSYLGPGNYGPTITQYFGFLEGRGALECTPQGIALARAVDGVLAKHPRYRWLTDPNALRFDPATANTWQSVMDLRRPSSAEQTAFLASFIQPAGITEEDDLGTARRAGMQLVLRSTAAFVESQGVPASEEDIRSTMVAGLAPDGTPVNLTDVAFAQAKWAGLQLRQYQRACLEGFYAAVHYELRSDVTRGHRIEELATILGKAAALAHADGPNVTVQGRVSALTARRKSAPSFAHASWRQASLRLARRRATLNASRASRSTDGVPLLAQSVEGIIFCGAEAANIERHRFGGQAGSRWQDVLSEQRDRVPLAEIKDLVDRFSNKTVAELASHCVRAYGINRHLKYATQLQLQMRDGKNRARLVEADDGLRRYYEQDSLPKWEPTPDRLSRTLQLLAQSGLLRPANEGYTVTSKARPYL